MKFLKWVLIAIAVLWAGAAFFSPAVLNSTIGALGKLTGGVDKSTEAPVEAEPSTKLRQKDCKYGDFAHTLMKCE